MDEKDRKQVAELLGIEIRGKEVYKATGELLMHVDVLSEFVLESRKKSITLDIGDWDLLWDVVINAFDGEDTIPYWIEQLGEQLGKSDKDIKIALGLL